MSVSSTNSSAISENFLLSTSLSSEEAAYRQFLGYIMRLNVLNFARFKTVALTPPSAILSVKATIATGALPVVDF